MFQLVWLLEQGSAGFSTHTGVSLYGERMRFIRVGSQGS